MLVTSLERKVHGLKFKLLLRHSNSIPMNQLDPTAILHARLFVDTLRQPSVLPGGKTVGGWLPNGFLEVDAVRIWILLLIFLRGTCNTRSSKHAPLKKSPLLRLRFIFAMHVYFSSSRPTFSSFSFRQGDFIANPWPLWGKKQHSLHQIGGNTGLVSSSIKSTRVKHLEIPPKNHNQNQPLKNSQNTILLG